MTFTEWIFPIFLFVTFALHWLAKGREVQLGVLLIASAIFYAWWDVRFLALIGFVILVSWASALLAGDHSLKRAKRNRWMIIGVTLNLLVLGVFKYFNFFTDTFVGVAAMFGQTLELSWVTRQIVLPVGISFYVFQAISYIVDVRRGELEREQRLQRVALYIAFFPQLVAGPIVRAASFIPQMDRTRTLSSELLLSGMRAFVIGWVYKAGLADNIAMVVDPVFVDINAYSNIALAGATLAFGAQIYFDFAGYSMMAIGVARWFGFYIPKNFDFPYFASSIDAFWRRWHISLSQWLRDYLYIPLGGNRYGEWNTYRNLFLTMFLGGLWHGAAWKFIVWGALHGIALGVHRFFFRKRKRMPLQSQALGIAATLGGIFLTQFFVIAVWAMFRAENIQDAVEIWAAMAGVREGGSLELPWWAWLAPIAVITDHAIGTSGLGARLSKHEIMRKPAVFYVVLGLLIGVLAGLYPLTPAPFIYFQF